MASFRSRLIALALPLLGIKRFFSQPERLEARIAKLRRKPTPRPRRRWARDFAITESGERGYPVITLTPLVGAAPDAPHLLYLHGGGYVMDIASLHWDLVADLCLRLGASATVPLYPLAPESKAAATLGQMRALYAELAERHGADRITVMGDSAGGGMTLALAQMLRDEGAALPARLVLYSPWLDATGTAEGQRAIEPRDRMLAVSGLKACGDLYRGDLAIDDPRVSPLFGALEGLPPMAIFSGGDDILLVDGRRLAQRLREPGMPDHIYREYDDMVHVWMLLPMPEAERVRAETIAFIRQPEAAR